MRSTLALLQRLSHKRGTRRKRRSVERGSSLRWSKVRSIDRDKAKVSIRLFRAHAPFLSLPKKPGAIVSKNHTREKVQFGKQHYQGERGPCARVVLLLPHHIEERETKTALCEIMCCACCVVFERALSTFSPDLRVYKSDTDSRPPRSPPGILPLRPGASRTDKIYYFSCISPSHPRRATVPQGK